MKDLRDKFSFYIQAQNLMAQNSVSEIFKDIAEEQGVYLHIEEQPGHGLRLGMSDSNHYTALMDAFDQRSAQMKTDHKAAYQKDLIKRFERLGGRLPDHVYEQHDIEPGASETAQTSNPISDAQREALLERVERIRKAHEPTSQPGAPPHDM